MTHYQVNLYRSDFDKLDEIRLKTGLRSKAMAIHRAVEIALTGDFSENKIASAVAYCVHLDSSWQRGNRHFVPPDKKKDLPVRWAFRTNFSFIEKLNEIKEKYGLRFMAEAVRLAIFLSA